MITWIDIACALFLCFSSVTGIVMMVFIKRQLNALERKIDTQEERIFQLALAGRLPIPMPYKTESAGISGQLTQKKRGRPKKNNKEITNKNE